MAAEYQPPWPRELRELEWWTRDEVQSALPVGRDRAERLVEDGIASGRLTVSYPSGVVLRDADPFSDRPADFDYQRFHRDDVDQWWRDLFSKHQALEPESRRTSAPVNAGPHLAALEGTRTALSPCRAERREAVDAYIAEVWKRQHKRLTRTDLWRSVGYKSRTDFEQWERCSPKATKTAAERFEKLLSEKPHLK